MLICTNDVKYVPGWLGGLPTKADDIRRCSGSPCQAGGDGRLRGLEPRNYEGTFCHWFACDTYLWVYLVASCVKDKPFCLCQVRLNDGASPIVMKERTFGGAGTCDAWYKNSEGYNWTLWPADCITYWSVLIILLLISHLSLKTISTCNCLQLTFTAILTQSFSQTLKCNILLSHPFSEVIGFMQ